jgi:hypothetical protein
MKNKFLVLYGLLIIGFTMCKKDSNCVKEQERQAPSAPSDERTGGPDAALYVNDFSTILGNTNKEDSLLNWCLAQGFTQINLYNIGTILGSGTTKTQLDNFVGKAHGVTYGIAVGFIAAGSTTANNIDTYCTNYTNKPDYIVSEYEFWNGANSFATFSSLVSAMTTVYNNTSPAVGRGLYVSQFVDAAAVSGTATIVQSLINNSETIFLVNYSNNAYNLSGTLTNKLQAIANEANGLSKVADIVILFNVNTGSSDPNIYNYFSTSGSNHPFVDAYNNLINDYNNSAITNKASLNIKGYAIYRYSNARLARP